MKNHHITKFAQKVQSSTDIAYLHSVMATGKRRDRRLAMVRLRELTILAAEKLASQLVGKNITLVDSAFEVELDVEEKQS